MADIQISPLSRFTHSTEEVFLIKNPTKQIKIQISEKYQVGGRKL